MRNVNRNKGINWKVTEINSKFHTKHALLAYGRVLEDTLYMARVIKAKEKESKLCPNRVFYY